MRIHLNGECPWRGFLKHGDRPAIPVPHSHFPDEDGRTGVVTAVEPIAEIDTAAIGHPYTVDYDQGFWVWVEAQQRDMIAISGSYAAMELELLATQAQRTLWQRVMGGTTP